MEDRDRDATHSAGFETTEAGVSGARATPILPGMFADRDDADDAAARQRALDLQEQRTAAMRVRAALNVGVLLWPGFLGVDAVFAQVYQGGIGLAVAARAAAFAVMLAVRHRLGAIPAPGPRRLIALDGLVFGFTSACVAVLAMRFGGLASPYPAGICVILVARAAFVATPWRDALAPIGIAVASYPIVAAIAIAVSPEVRAQLADTEAVGIAVLHVALLLCTAAFLFIGGQTTWALRRQVFEARSIGRYRLVRRIGRGGMGEVWQAHHAGLRRDVAIKILHSDRGRPAVALRRFEREVRATAELRHPNTIRIFDYGATDDGLWYYAMEHIDGEDLAQRVRRDGPLDDASAVHIVVQAARALAEAHHHGIVHRDVKPHNILVTQAGGARDFVKVVDFGIARRLDEGDGSLTREGWIGGTPSYISPEVARGLPADACSDVYGLGAVLYFLLTGEPPFAATAPDAVMAAHVLEPVEPPGRRARRAIAPALEAVVLRSLAKDPAERYRDAAALADALDEVELAQRN